MSFLIQLALRPQTAGRFKCSYRTVRKLKGQAADIQTASYRLGVAACSVKLLFRFPSVIAARPPNETDRKRISSLFTRTCYPHCHNFNVNFLFSVSFLSDRRWIQRAWICVFLWSIIPTLTCWEPGTTPPVHKVSICHFASTMQVT